MLFFFSVSNSLLWIYLLFRRYHFVVLTPTFHGSFFSVSLSLFWRNGPNWNSCASRGSCDAMLSAFPVLMERTTCLCSCCEAAHLQRFKRLLITTVRPSHRVCSTSSARQPNWTFSKWGRCRAMTKLRRRIPQKSEKPTYQKKKKKITNGD